MFQINIALKKLSKYDNPLIKSIVQYSEKDVIIRNKGAFYKSLDLLNGKNINKKMRNGFKYKKLSLYQLFDTKLRLEKTRKLPL